MKEKYEPPVMEIVDIDKEDIIFASGEEEGLESGIGGGGGGGAECP